jgi:hypothetical protein
MCECVRYMECEKCIVSNMYRLFVEIESGVWCVCVCAHAYMRVLCVLRARVCVACACVCACVCVCVHMCAYFESAILICVCVLYVCIAPQNKGEEHLLKYLKQWFPNNTIHSRARKIAGMLRLGDDQKSFLELDVWMPELKLGFEYQV